MRDQDEFSYTPGGLWKPLDDTPLQYVMGAYWHHLAACTVREVFPVRPDDELAGRLGVTNLVYFRRQFSGVYRVPMEDVCIWAVALDDVSVLPHFETARALYPPGLLPGADDP